jgi:hypothetical protein
MVIGIGAAPWRCSLKPEEMFGFGASSAWAAAESSGSSLAASSGSEQLFGIIRCLPGKPQDIVLLLPESSLAAFAAATPPWALTRTIVRRALGQDAAPPWFRSKKVFFIFFLFLFDIRNRLHYILYMKHISHTGERND